jgi:hypothetical protein
MILNFATNFLYLDIELISLPDCLFTIFLEPGTFFHPNWQAPLTNLSLPKPKTELHCNLHKTHLSFLFVQQHDQQSALTCRLLAALFFHFPFRFPFFLSFLSSSPSYFFPQLPDRPVVRNTIFCFPCRCCLCLCCSFPAQDFQHEETLWEKHRRAVYVRYGTHLTQNVSIIGPSPCIAQLDKIAVLLLK